MPTIVQTSSPAAGNNNNAEQFLQTVYEVLVSYHPNGLSFTQLGQRVNRSGYRGARGSPTPRWGRLETIDRVSFQIREGRVYAKLDSPRYQRISGETSNFDPMVGFRHHPQSSSSTNPLPAAPQSAALPPMPPVPPFVVPPPAARDNSTSEATNPASQQNNNNSRENAANSFYSFLKAIYESPQHRHLLHDIDRIKLKPFYDQWKDWSGLRCGLYYILQNLQRTRRLRYTRQNKLRFSFMKEENRAYVDLARAQADKGGITISNITFPGDIVYHSSRVDNVSAKNSFQITNNGPISRTLTKVRIMKDEENYSHNILTLPLVIAPNETRSFELCYQPKGIGSFPSSMAFTFDSSFAILRTFAPNVTSEPELRRELKPSAPYVRKSRVRRSNATEKLHGEMPPSSSRKFVVELLSKYELTESVMNSVRSGEIENELVELYSHYQRARQSRENNSLIIHDDQHQPLKAYSLLQSCMLLVEECQMVTDLEEYSLENVSIEPVREGSSIFYYIDVPGLAEKRPSVLIGDDVEVRLVDRENIAFRGAVWDVEQTRIKVRFHKRFSEEFYMRGMKVNVFFSFRRTGLKLMHDTLQRMRLTMCSTDSKKEAMLQMLFPTEIDTEGNLVNIVESEYRIPSFYNRQLDSLQKKAVKQMVADYKQSSTFVLFGPPGTGKTVTLVEAIKQMFRKLKKQKEQELEEARQKRSLLERVAKVVGLTSRTIKDTRYHQSLILVMAPSNYAADLLVDRLSDTINNKEMFRFMSFSRKSSDVASPKVLNYCTIDDSSKHFVNPTVEELLLKDSSTDVRVIVCTCAMATRLYYHGFLAEHFAAFFIDESGHCWETEAVAGFANLVLPQQQPESSSSTKQLLVLAGDPKQLGPITRSPFASMTEFDKSLLERLVDDEVVFKKDPERFPIPFDSLSTEPHNHGYNPSYIVKLTNCYRCHLNIMEVPNELFYDNDLQSTADPLVTSSCLSWEKLPNKQFPVLFHGCIGINEQEKSSPSWFNLVEIELVLQYVKDIISYGQRRGISAKDIGIIAPYSSQVKKIQKGLKLKNINDITVGSCEQFQGQERKVIIISTVRSSLEYLQSDEKYNIGFLSNPKRFNVAITRAKSLVIVIGNPQVLASDRCWGKLLWFCVDNGSYVGNAPLPSRGSDDNNNSGDDNNADDIDELAELANRLNLNDVHNDNGEGHDGSDQYWRREE